MKRLLIIGSGGHAKVVTAAAEAAGWSIAGIVDATTDRTELLGHPISASCDTAEADAFIIAVGDNRTRRARFEEWSGCGLAAATVIHPSAIVASTASIGAGTFVSAGVIVNPDARIGDNVILNTGCIVEHDCVVADHAHVGPASSLCGNVSVGSGALLGTGVNAIPGISIGTWSVCGAGAAVVKDIPADCVCAGVPARIVRAVEEL